MKNIKIRALVLAVALIGGIVLGAITNETRHHLVNSWTARAVRLTEDSGTGAGSVAERFIDAPTTAAWTTGDSK